MHADIVEYNNAQALKYNRVCSLLATEITQNIPGATSKIWHKAPVWFIDGNPVVGYWVRKDRVQLLFWSGQSFDEPALTGEGTFKAAEIRYEDIDDINVDDLLRWLEKAQTIQWDYKNIVKRKGKLVKLTS